MLPGHMLMTQEAARSRCVNVRKAWGLVLPERASMEAKGPHAHNRHMYQKGRRAHAAVACVRQ